MFDENRNAPPSLRPLRPLLPLNPLAAQQNGGDPPPFIFPFANSSASTAFPKFEAPAADGAAPLSTPSESEEARDSSLREYEPAKNWRASQRFPVDAAATEADVPIDVPGYALPVSHLLAHEPFLDACEGGIDGSTRDWNGEFQVLWSEQLQAEIWGFDKRDFMSQFLADYEAYAKELVEVHMTYQEEQAPQHRHSNATVRYGNLILHVWQDGKLGSHMQRSFRAVMEAHAPFLHFPLLATFAYLDKTVSVMAALPTDRRRAPVYTANGRRDAVVNNAACEMLSVVVDSLNLLVGGVEDGTAKIKGVELREGDDVRLYITTAIGLLPQMWPSTGRATPRRRWLHLIQHPPAPWGPCPIGVYCSAVVSLRGELPRALRHPVDKRNQVLVDILHENGLNVCLLCVLLHSLLQLPKEDVDEFVEPAARMVAVEVLARAIRTMMLRTLAIEKGSRTIKAVNRYLSRTAAAMLDPSPRRFLDTLAPAIRSQFVVEDSWDMDTVFTALFEVLHTFGSRVTRRVCQLAGIHLLRGSAAQVICRPCKQNYSSFFSVEHEKLLTSLTRDTSKYPPRFTTAYLRPLRVRVSSRNGRSSAAWREMRLLIAEQGQHSGRRFLNASTWCAGAAVAAQCGNHDDCITLVERATRVFSDFPAYVIVSANPAVALPSYFHFFNGQMRAKMSHGYIYCLLGSHSAAEEKFTEALHLSSALDPKPRALVYWWREQAMIGLLEVASHSGKDKVIDIGAVWEGERRSMVQSRLSAHINEVLGGLFFQHGLFGDAVSCLQECLESTEHILGPTSIQVGEILNKLAYIYYRWNAPQYGLYCSCMLHRAEEIMVLRCGPFSAQRLAIVENILSVFIQCGMFVEVSQRLHQLRAAIPQYGGRISKEHPTIARLSVIEERLRVKFYPIAVALIQKRWRRYSQTVLVRHEQVSGALVLERVGRGFLVRRLLHQLRYGVVSLEELTRHQRMYYMRTFSMPLVNASPLMSDMYRNWNSEYQYHRVFAPWWDSVEGAIHAEEMASVERTFEQTALQYLNALQDGRANGDPVPNCDTSVLYRNMVFTKVHKEDALAKLHVKLCARLRANMQLPITTSLCAYFELADCAVYVEALIPLHLHPQYILTADGRPGVQMRAGDGAVLDEFTKSFRKLHLLGEAATPFPPNIEIVRGTDELQYITNAFGLVLSLICGTPFTTGAVDALSLPRSEAQRVAALLLGGAVKEAAEVVEKALLDEDNITNDSLPAWHLFTYLATAHYTLGADADGASKLFERAITAMEGLQQFLAAALACVTQGSLLRSREAEGDALASFERAITLMTKPMRLHATYGAFYILGVAQLILRGMSTPGYRVDSTTLSRIVHAVEYGEPTLVLFTTCERLVGYTKAVGDTAEGDHLRLLRERRARNLSEAERARIVGSLVKRSDELFDRGGNDSYNDCVVLLETAIHIFEASAPESLSFGVVLNKYGEFLTSQNKLKDASKALDRAYAVLHKTAPLKGTEMRTWEKNREALHYRRREAARRALKRAMRRWKEQRRADARMLEREPERFAAKQMERAHRRCQMLQMLEATARVRVVETESEARYVLFRSQGRMRNSAALQQTYGARLGLFNGKLQTAMDELVQLAYSSKELTWTLFCDTWASMIDEWLQNFHRLQRRTTIRTWKAEVVSLKLWHIEGVDLAIREEYLQAHLAYLLRCTSAEERVWRRVITKNQKKSKNILGRAISRVLHHKPKRQSVDLRAFTTDEERRRERLVDEEEEGFMQIMKVFTFGPEIYSDNDDSD